MDILPQPDPCQMLQLAIAWAELPGVPSTLDKIRPAVEAGASLEALFENGCTPLTFAIVDGMGSPKAVEVLLELGADPSRRDRSGWTPWGLCLDKMEIPSLEARMKKIAASLRRRGADTSDEILLSVKRAAIADDRAALEALFARGADIDSPLLSPLGVAVSEGNANLASHLLELGAHPDGPDQKATHLMSAVQANRIDLVKILLGAGADPNLLWQGLPGHSLIHLAKLNGHKDLVRWLSRVFPSMEGAETAKAKKLDPLLKLVQKAGTNGVNSERDNLDILRALDRWNLMHGIHISEAASDRVSIEFLTLPRNLSGLLAELHDLCPDLVDQGFGCMDDFLAMRERDGIAIPAEWSRWSEGVDLDAPGAGLKILERSLRETSKVSLWWD